MGNFSKFGQVGRKAGEEAAEETSLWRKVADTFGIKAVADEEDALRKAGQTVDPETVRANLEAKYPKAAGAKELDIESAMDAPKPAPKPKAVPEEVTPEVRSRAVETPVVDTRQSKFIDDLHRDPAKKEQHIKNYLESISAAAKRGEEPEPNLWFKTAETTAAAPSRPASSGRAALPPKEILVDTDTFAGVQRPIYGLPPAQEVKLLGPANQLVTVPLGEAVVSGKYKDFKLVDVPGQDFDLVGPVAVPRGSQYARPIQPKQLPAGETVPPKPAAAETTPGGGDVPPPSKFAGKALFGAGALAGIGALLFGGGEEKETPKQPEAAPAAPAPEPLDPERVRGSDVVAVALSTPPEPKVAKGEDPEAFQAAKEYSAAQTDFAKSLKVIQSEYRLEKDSIRKQELAEKLINGIGMLLAGLYGQKHGYNMSGIQFDKTDWAEKYRAAREDMMADVSTTKSQYEARKELIESQRLDAAERNKFRAYKQQQEQKILDTALEKWKLENQVQVQEATLRYKQESVANQKAYYDYLITAGAAKNEKEARRVVADQRKLAQSFMTEIRNSARGRSGADRRAAKAKAAVINQQFQKDYGTYLFDPNQLEDMNANDIAEQILGQGGL